MSIEQLRAILATIEGDTITEDGNAIQYRFDDDGTLTVEVTTPDGDYEHRRLQLAEL